LPYEVKGEAASVFNIVSSPTISVNAEFLQVPPEFQGEDITETVMGSVEVAFCSRLGATHLRFNVTDGNLSTTLVDPILNARGRSRTVPEIMASAGLKLIEERYVCTLRRMACTWEPANELPRKLELPQVDLGYSRIKMTNGKVQVDVTRNAMVSLGGTNDRPHTTVDCELFKTWEMAVRSCRALLKGTAPQSKRHTWLLMLVMPTLPREQQFFFTQIELPQVYHAQHELHGLLGQRAIAPEYTQKIDHAARAAAATRDKLYTDRTPSGALGGKQGGASRGVDPEPAAGRPGVGGPDPSRMAVLFGAQGEGAIVGSYDEYRTASLSEHDRFRYSRLACANPARPQTFGHDV